ncbi:hypothetical protein XH80_19820 [Bradyrhizobium sp. CCBAU 45384]|nr:hypothetical protein [Bradyrhizobium sp. CCBAU 45384]
MLDSKERLRRLESSLGDPLKAAGSPGTEFGSDDYLALAAEIRRQVEREQQSIARLEKLRTTVRLRAR